MAPRSPANVSKRLHAPADALALWAAAVEQKGEGQDVAHAAQQAAEEDGCNEAAVGLSVSVGVTRAHTEVGKDGRLGQVGERACHVRCHEPRRVGEVVPIVMAEDDAAKEEGEDAGEVA